MDGDGPVEMVDIPPHPITYLFKARLATNSRRQANYLSLEKGNEGKILPTIDKNIHITLPRLSLDVSG